jgi:acyl-coenzyme A synthetase/AMP-(fatty) acid ligase/aryl carrier-like protein
VHSTWTTLTPRIAGTASRSVGVPLPGESLSVRDRAGRLLPPGVLGEIHVGGVGVALGYLGLDDLTAERFGTDPDGTRVYRSGDRGRMLPDGTIEYLGRLDDQLKLRGYRIEPGEVRAALLAVDGVTAAAVVIGGTPDAPRLDAYVTPAGTDPVATRERVRALLPPYMVPATVTALDAFPLTLNGKLDRARLPRPGADPEPGVPEASEDLLAGIWERLTGLRVRPEENLFDAGADSVTISRFVAELRARGLTEAAVGDVYRLATLRGLAGHVRSRSA